MWQGLFQFYIRHSQRLCFPFFHVSVFALASCNIFVFLNRDVNNNIMELLIMAYACKTSSAKSIVGVIPYLPYSKQCEY